MWIPIILPSESNEVADALAAMQPLYPIEYAEPVHTVDDGAAGIVMSHSLIPEAMKHAFSTFGVLMSPDLPLTRAQQEMIARVVSAKNHCYY